MTRLTKAMEIGVLANAIINSNKETHMAARATGGTTPAKKKKKPAAPAVKAVHAVEIATKGKYDDYGRKTATDVSFSKQGTIVTIKMPKMTNRAIEIDLSTLKKVMAELDKTITVS